jgi:O-antigen ligase
VDPGVSFWGSVDRLAGYISLGLTVFFGFLVARVTANPTHRRRFLFAWCGSWSLVALIAVIERFWIGPWAQFHTPGGRVISTIGNPIFLAGGLILAYGITGAALLRLPRSRRRDLLFGLASALFLAATIFTETRGAFVGMAVGGSVGIFALGRWSRSRLARTAAILVPALLIAFAAFLWLGQETSIVRSSDLLRRAATTFKVTDPSRIQRFQLWGMAIEAIKSRPLTGWGLENFDTAVDRLYQPSFIVYGIASSYSDRVHNVYLDSAAAAGVLGLGALLFFYGALGHRILGERKIGMLGAGSAAVALGSFAAYLAQNLTAFDTLATYWNLAVAAGLLAGLRAAGSSSESAERAAPPFVAALVAAALLIFGGIVPLVRGANAVHVALTAQDSRDLARAAEMLRGFRSPYRAQEDLRIANEIFKRVGNSPWDSAFADLLRQAEDLLRDAVQRRSTHFAERYTLGNVLLLQALHGIRPYDEAVAVFEEARALAPRRQIVDYQIGNAFLASGRPAEAVAAFRRALALDENIPESHWHLGRGLAAAEDEAGAAEQFRIANRAGFGGNRPPQEYSVAIRALAGAGELRMIWRLYKEWTCVDPENPDVFAGFAAISGELGFREIAEQAASRALLLDPTIAQEIPAFVEKYGLSADRIRVEDGGSFVACSLPDISLSP